MPYEPLSGSYRIRLDANESYVDWQAVLGDEIRDAVSKVVLDRYPDPYATQVCALFASYYSIDPQHVTAGNGLDEVIAVILSSFLQKGERVLTFIPDFSMYAFYCNLYELDCITMPKDEALQPDLEKAAALIREQDIRAVIFSNPCNPTSRGLTQEQVRAFIESVPDTLVILDEAYMDFYDRSLIREATAYGNVILLRTCSKALALAGIRLGFAVANPALTSALRAAKSPYNVNALTQAVAAVVLSHPDRLREATDQMVCATRELYDGICAICGDGVAVGNPCTNFVFLRVGTERAKRIDNMLRSRGIAIRRMGEYLRVTAGSPTENADFLTEFAKVWKECAQ